MLLGRSTTALRTPSRREPHTGLVSSCTTGAHAHTCHSRPCGWKALEAGVCGLWGGGLVSSEVRGGSIRGARRWNERNARSVLSF